MKKIIIEIETDDNINIDNETQDTEIVFTSLYYSVKQKLDELGMTHSNIIVKRGCDNE